MYITTLESCPDCNSRCVLATEEYPTKEQIQEANDKIGGMYCIGVYIYEVEIGVPSDKRKDE